MGGQRCPVARAQYQRDWHSKQGSDYHAVAYRRRIARDPEFERKKYQAGLLKDPARNRRNNLRRYNLTIDEYDAMLLRQGNRCAISTCEATEPGGRGRWHVDHDHETGMVRCLLCHYCNVGLGHFKDSPTMLVAAATYLNKSRE